MTISRREPPAPERKSSPHRAICDADDLGLDATAAPKPMAIPPPGPSGRGVKGSARVAFGFHGSRQGWTFDFLSDLGSGRNCQKAGMTLQICSTCVVTQKSCPAECAPIDGPGWEWYAQGVAWNRQDDTSSGSSVSVAGRRLPAHVAICTASPGRTVTHLTETWRRFGSPRLLSEPSTPELGGRRGRSGGGGGLLQQGRWA